jgi:putative transposase
MMAATDVKDLLDIAVEKTGIQQISVRHRPRLLSDNGPAYVSEEFKEYLQIKGMTQTHGPSHHPMTEGKIERYHESLDNVTPADVYYGRHQEIITRREQLKQRTLKAGKRYNLSQPIAQSIS